MVLFSSAIYNLEIKKMKAYNNLITWLLNNKNFNEIDDDNFLFCLYQIWDFGMMNMIFL